LLIALALPALAQEFEAVSIRPNKSGEAHSGTHTNNGGLRADNVNLRTLITMAWDIRDYQLQGPDWLQTERFDIAAKFPDGMPKEREAESAALRTMMQKMLHERFKLASHRESKTFRVQNLVVAAGGIRFEAVPNCESHNQNSNGTHYVGKCVSMASLAEFLSRRGDFPVLDRTGLKSFYDMTLDWAPEGPDSTGPTLDQALREQLGLKLDSARAVLEVMVLDHAEKTPTEN
jgi:uncharacterized protein (TIGR03435 family)